jgi:hypothetical protein
MTYTFTYVQSDDPQLTDDMIVCDQFKNFHIQVGLDDVFYLIKERADGCFEDMGKYYSRAMAYKRLLVYARGIA